MPGNTSRTELERLYNLIQEGREEEAATALRAIVRGDRDNEDAWWLLANAVADPAEAKESLDQVLRLNPANTQARDLLERLDGTYPDLGPIPTTELTDLDFDAIPSTPAASNPWDDEFGIDKEPSFAASSAATAATSPADDWGGLEGLDNVQSSEDTTAPVSTTPASPSSRTPNFDQPEFFPEPFAGVNLDKPTGAPVPAANTPSPIFTGDVPIQRDADGDAPSRWVPLALAAMLVVVLGIAGYYILTNQVGSGTPGATVTLVAAVPTGQTVFPTLDPNATLAPTLPPPTPFPTDAATVAITSTTGGSLTVATPTLAPATTGEAGTSIAPTGATTRASTSAATSAVTASSAATGAATIAPSTLPLAESLTKLTEDFKAAGFSDATFAVTDTVLGKTLSVTFCSKTGIDLLRGTDKGRDLIATEGAPYKAEVEALGVQIVNCGNAANILYNRVVPIRVAVQYAEKKIAAVRFRASWINP